MGSTKARKGTMERHTLDHALSPAACQCPASQMTHCVICEKILPYKRPHLDTCGLRCFRALCKKQREDPTFNAAIEKIMQQTRGE